MNCPSDLKNLANSQPLASNFKSFSLSLEQFFLTVGQNNFGNKIPFLKFLTSLWKTWVLGCCVKSLRYSRPCTTSLKASQASFSDIGLSVGTTRTSPSFRSSKTARNKKIRLMNTKFRQPDWVCKEIQCGPEY